MKSVMKNNSAYKTWCNTKGKLHREDGPAFEYLNGTKKWCINGKYHREDGPAIEYLGGKNHWYLNGVEVTEEQHTFCVKHGISFDNYGDPVFPSDAIQTKYLLIYG